jgi:hypothetical protein
MNVERQSVHGYMASRGHALGSHNTIVHALVTEHTLFSSFFSVTPPTMKCGSSGVHATLSTRSRAREQDGVDCSLHGRGGGRKNSYRVGGVPLDKHCLST